VTRYKVNKIILLQRTPRISQQAFAQLLAIFLGARKSGGKNELLPLS
jgi:hypothetical protein